MNIIIREKVQNSMYTLHVHAWKDGFIHNYEYLPVYSGLFYQIHHELVIAMLV